MFASPDGVSVDMYVGLSILHIACAFDQEQVITYLAKYGSNVLTVTTPSGQTLMHTCAFFGTAAPLAVLVQHGASLKATNARRQQPLHLAALRGHLMCAKTLLRAGADLEARDESGNAPLHDAVAAGAFDVAQEIVNHDADVNAANAENGTALHYTSSVPLVSLLILHGADPNVVLDATGSHASATFLSGTDKPRTAFNLFLDRMPEGCNEILNKYLKTNGKSTGAADLEICFEYELFERELELHPAGGEIGTLLNVAEADQRDILKHPVCEVRVINCFFSF